MESKSMKNIIKATALACLMAAASNVAAAGPSANVQIKGTVKMGACTPTLDNGGAIDLGNITPNFFPAQGSLNLGAKSINLTITCSSPTLVNFRINDNRSESRSNNAWYSQYPRNIAGLGKTSAGINIGNYGFWIVSISSGDAIEFTPNIKTWAKVKNNTAQVINANTEGYQNNGKPITFALSGTVIPEPISTVTFGLEFNPSISPDVKLVTQAESIDGNSTFTLTYM